MQCNRRTITGETIIMSCKVAQMVRMVPHGKRMSSTLSQVDPGEILPFSAMPGPPSLPLLGHLHLLSSKKTTLSMDKFQTSLMEQHGDMVRLQVPGKNMVFLYNPDHFHVLSRNEPRIPITPIFDIFDYIRTHKLGTRYTSSKGLISNVEDWYDTRKAVQKVMMRPNSAMHYVPEVEEIVLELIEKVEAEKVEESKTLDFQLTNLNKGKGSQGLTRIHQLHLSRNRSDISSFTDRFPKIRSCWWKPPCQAVG